MKKKKNKATEKDKQTNSKKSPRADSKKKDEQSYQTYPIAGQRTKKDPITVKWTLKGINFSATGASQDWISLQDYYLLNKENCPFPDNEKLAEDFRKFIISADSQIQRRGFREVKKSFLQNMKVQAALIYSFYNSSETKNKRTEFTKRCMYAVWGEWLQDHGLLPLQPNPKDEDEKSESFYFGYIQDGMNIIKRDFTSLKICVGILKYLLEDIKRNESKSIKKVYFDFAHEITTAIYLLLNPSIIFKSNNQIEEYKKSAIKIFPHLKNHSF